MNRKNLFLALVALLLVIACTVCACNSGGNNQASSGTTEPTGTSAPNHLTTTSKNTQSPAKNGTRIRFDFGGQTAYGTLDDNSVSRDLVSRLPLTLTFSDYGGTEKIAYLPEGSPAWDASDAPDACTPASGDITMYSPWGNLAIFYRPFRNSDGLVPLGGLDDGGAEKFAAMTGEFTVKISLATDAGDTGQTTKTENPEIPEQPQKSKVLVAYFSCTGHTKAVAEKIASLTGGDLYEIVPAEPYSSADLNYSDSNCRANREMNDPSSRPAIGSESIDISAYDTIIIGYPIWWGTMPRIINTFFDTYDLSGKTIVPFCTSGSSGVSRSVSDIKSAEPGATVANGLRASGANDGNIESWLRKSGVTK